jgi:putative ABC transport system permease protein
MRLARSLILRPLWNDLPRTGLTLLAVALGVAVVVAIDLASDAATGSFRSSLETVAGKTDLEITATGGVEAVWLGRLASLPYDAHFSPVMEGKAEVQELGPVPLYGVDLLGADGIVLSSRLARRVHSPELTFQLAGRAQRFPVSKTIEDPSSEFLLMDLAEADRILGRAGKLDRIDVTVGAHEELARVEQAVRSLLPASYLVRRPGARSEENQRMLRAFRWNLRVLSYISLVVGAFLIYNTISISVVRRRAEIGVLRALGAARGTIFALFLGEAWILGLAGAAAGVGLGRWMAAGTVGLISATVNALFTTSRPAPVALTWSEAGAGMLTGAMVAILSAFGPARAAMQTAPTEAMRRGAYEHAARIRWRRGLGWAALLAAAAAGASQMPPVGGFPAFGYLSGFLAVGATAAATPAAVLAIHRATSALTRRRAESLLASRSLTASLARTSVIVAALATAIAMMTSVGIMVGSFRETVALWLDLQLRADLYVRPAAASAAGEFPPLAAEVVGTLESTPGVGAVDLFRATALEYGGQRATLAGSNMELARRYGRLRFQNGGDRETILRSLPGRDRAILSEPFANLHHIRAGEQLRIPIGAREVALTVAGIYYEYSSSQGYVVVDQSTLLKYLPGQPATSAAVYLKPGADAGAVQRAIERRAAGYGVAVTLNQELRRRSIAVFDRTFTITYALEAVAVLVGMLGAANSLLALALDRRRELGLLRYLGASSRQIRGMILTEAAFLGLLAILLGLALGFALSLLLVFVVNKQSFGWTTQFHPPRELLSGALAAVWCVTVLAGLYPARLAARLNPIDVIHEE